MQYSYGVEGDPSAMAEQQYQRNADLVQQPFMGNNELDISLRGEEHTALIASLSENLMRSGLSLKMGALVLMSVFYVAFGGRWLFSFQSHPSLPSQFHLFMVFFLMMYLAGAICLALFQAFVADDAKWTIGFRTGSKILSAAVTLDMLATMLRLVQYLYLYNYLSVAWWSRYNVSKSEWTLFTVHNFLDALSCMAYGLAFFYMEMYHDEGTSQDAAYWMMGLYSAAGIIGCLSIFTGYGGVLTLLVGGAALLLATQWAFVFEPLLGRWSPDLHSRAVNAEIVPQEKQVSNPADPQIPSNPPIQYQYSAQPSMAIEQAGAQVLGRHQGVDAYGDLPTQYDYSQMQNQLPPTNQPYGIVGES